MVDRETMNRNLPRPSRLGELPSVAIAADDLTGAADALAPLAARGWDCRVVLDADGLRPARRGAAQALDTNCRSTSLAAQGPEAVARVRRHLAAAEVALLKVDSLLRGHVAADVAALADGRTRIVVAPAFPARGRGLRGEPARTLAAELAAHGLDPHVVELGADGDELASRRVLVVEAETEADLLRVVADRDPSTLWVGSAGLAGALAAAAPRAAVVRPALRSGPVLTVVGSRTEIASRQVQEALRGRDGLLDVDAGGDLLVAPSPGDGPDDVEQVRAIARGLRAAEARFEALVLVGGDTARAVLSTFGIPSLDVVGELEPGTAVCVAPDGRTVVTKSGSFGDDGALRRIHERLA
jgi:4-hydroxythreonine-4-phosphate dehydrogenase